jgi:general secretion pathway protein D
LIWGRYIMKKLCTLLICVVVVALCVPGYADSASAAFKRGVKAEAQNNYDAAFEAYKQAYQLKAKDPKYQAAFTRIRFYAAQQHVHAGELLQNAAKYTEALTEFQRAAEIDPTSFIAQEEMRRTAEMVRKQAQRAEPVPPKPVSPLMKMAEEAEGPVELKALSTTPINLRMSETADKIYKVLGKLAGINILFDADYKAQKVSIELNDVTPREALDMLALESKTFWRPVSANTILVASDTVGKRKELQGNVMKTFYLKNVSSPAELQEAANTVKGILDVTRMQLIPTQSAVVLRGTTAQMVLAQKLFSDIDKPKSEVVIDIAVMQVNRSRLRTLGTSPPTSASVALIPGGAGSGAGGGLTINSLKNLTAGNFAVSIPGATFSFLMSDGNTKLIQNPEIRALDNQKATLKIGDRVPIATGSFAGVSGGVNPLVNTQFQYLDVGVNIDITPHVHSADEVTLKMVLEISSVTGQQNLGGVSQPIIGQRRIEHETRLRDGEVNLVGGILEDTETTSLSGYPWISKLPVLKYLFGQEEKDVRENEIVFAITPHIVRAQDVTEQNLRLVDVGTGSEILLRHKDPAIEASNSSARRAPRGGPAQVNNPQKDARGGTAVPATNPALLRGPLPSKDPAHPKVDAIIPTAALSPPDRPVQSKDLSKVGSATSTAQLPPPSRADQFNAPHARNEVPTLAPGSSRPLAPPQPASQAARVAASADPCPYGQHLVDWKDGVANCAFD